MESLLNTLQILARFTLLVFQMKDSEVLKKKNKMYPIKVEKSCRRREKIQIHISQYSHQ